MEFPQPGDLIAEKYRLDEVIGQGGFATVFGATDVAIDRDVAVKVLRVEPGDPFNRAARFTREAKVLGSLKGAHTVRMFDFGHTENGVPYMVFERLGGIDLSELLAERGTLTADEAEHVMRQLLASLREAHAAGLLHRDVKPSNIRVFEYQDDPLRVKLMDFGIARPRDRDLLKLTRTGAQVGTVAYMAPEQAVGAELTPSADLFSLALVIAESLSGDLRAVREAASRGRPLSVRAGEPLGDALNRMLERDPDRRLQSVDAALDALDGRTETRPPRPATRVEPAPPQQRKHPAGWTRIAIGVALTIGCVAIVAIIAEDSDDETPRATRKPVVQMPSIVAGSATARVEPESPLAPATAPDASIGADVTSADGCGKPPPTAANGLTSYADGFDSYRWVRHVPRAYDPEHRHPLLFTFHHDSATAASIMQDARLRDFADAHRVAVIAVDGGGELFPWQQRIPVAAVRRIFEEQRRALCVDESRVFLHGHGSGGLAVEAVACEPWVRGLITTSHRADVGELPCARLPKPYLHFHPTKSKHVPPEGGANCTKTRRLISLAEHEERWRQRNRCSGAKRTVSRVGDSFCATWDCETPFVTCHVDGGHHFPGTDPRAIDLLGCDGPAPDYPYHERFWSFIESL